MGQQDQRRAAKNRKTMRTGWKAALITALSVVVIAGFFIPIRFYSQNQQAAMVAEQERISAEQEEAERLAAEELARLEREAQAVAEAERLAAEGEASRLEAERAEQERLAAEAEQARLEAETQAEAERIAAEEARQQVEATQQPTSNENANSNTQTEPSTGSSSVNPLRSGSESDNHQRTMEEPASGKGKEQADRMGGVWCPEMEGWVFIDEIGDYIYIYKNGGSSVLTGEDITTAKKYIK